MRSIDVDTALAWRGRTVVDRDGEKVGELKDVFLDESDRPGWGAVHTGLFGLRQTMVPLYDAEEQDDDHLRLPYGAAEIKDAPNAEADVQLSPEDEDRLYRHYAIDERGTREGEAEAREADAEARDGEAEAAGGAEGAGAVSAERPEAGERAGDEGAMTRSEEEIAHAGGGPMRPRERVRLRKVLVTDHVKKSVPVQREEVRLEHEPPREGG